MTGWAGGAANRTRRRDQRGREDGQSLRQDVARILADWRAAHGWKLGTVWDPYLGMYVERS